MTNSFPDWITRRMVRGVKGFNLDSYLVALEGWRRGLRLTWYYDPSEVTDMKIIGFNPLGKTFSLESSDQKKMHFFYRSRGDKVSNEAIDIVHHKEQAKALFIKENVPTPKGIVVDIKTDKSEVKKQISRLQFPLVVKPSLGSLGKGVTTNIQNMADIFVAIDDIATNYEDYKQIIIEEYVEGTEYRVYVVNNEVAAVTKRIAANVVGDGISTIKQLIETKNKERKNNPYLARKSIKLDDTVIKYLEKQKRTIVDIPQQHEVVRLKGQANISAGGDPVDATDTLDETNKQIAIDAVKSIPNLHHAGVDLIVNNENTVVLEVNATADIAMHVFPLAGTPQNVPAKILDFYYPNSNNNVAKRTQLFFDYNDIQNVLRKNLAQELAITNAPEGDFATARYIVSGKVQRVGYRNWIRREAIKSELHGYTRNLKNKSVVVVVGGNNEKVEAFKRKCEKGPPKAKVKRVRELEWGSPIKLGFEIRR